MSIGLTFVSCILEFYIFYDFFKAFFSKRAFFNRKGTVLPAVLLFSLAYFGVNLFNLAGLNMAMFPLFLFAFASALFQGRIRSKLLYILFACCIFFGCEFLFLVILEIPNFILGENGTVDLSQMPWHLFTLKLLTYFICNIFKQFSHKSETRMDGKIFICYLTIPLASLGIMILTYYSGIDFRDKPQMQTLLCILFALMQVGNMIIFYAFQRYSRELQQNMQHHILITEQNLKQSHYAKLETMHAQNREFIHNINNHLRTIGNLIDDGRSEDALKIIKDLDIKLGENSGLIYSSHSVLNAILTDKNEVAEKEKIEMDIYVEPVINLNGISNADLITMLGNLLDNALEAAAKCSENRTIKVRIYMENEGNIFVTKITNTYTGPLRLHGERLLTTKKDVSLHGIGLSSVQTTADKYDGTLDYFTKDNVFTALLILYPDT